MKKFLCLILCVILVGGLFGCGDGKVIPEGIDNKEFYKDMVNILPELEKGLQQKNISYYEKLYGKYVGKYFRNDLNIKLNDKEQDILECAKDVILNYKLYINIYLASKQQYDTSKLIDVDRMYGDELLKSVQKLSGLLGVDYKFD